jgi:hypothetical protein
MKRERFSRIKFNADNSGHELQCVFTCLAKNMHLTKCILIHLVSESGNWTLILFRTL